MGAGRLMQNIDPCIGQSQLAGQSDDNTSPEDRTKSRKYCIMAMKGLQI